MYIRSAPEEIADEETKPFARYLINFLRKISNRKSFESDRHLFPVLCFILKPPCTPI